MESVSDLKASFGEVEGYHGSQQPEDSSDISSTSLSFMLDDHQSESKHVFFRPKQLANIIRSMDIQGLDALGGAEGLLRGLCTRPTHGIVTAKKYQNDSITHSDPLVSLEERYRIFGHNVEQFSRAGLWCTMVSTWKNSVPLLVLSAFSIILPSLTLVLFCETGFSKDWIVGPVLGISIIFTVLVHSFVEQDVEKHLAFTPGLKGKTRVIRDGKEQLVNPEGLVVGDIAFFEAGDVLPCDGVFLGGHGVRCDESNITGRSESAQKATLKRCLGLHQGYSSTAKTLGALNCFLLSGSRVMEGLGRYVVVAVGPYRYSSTSARHQRQVELESEITNFCNNALVYGVSPSIVVFDLILNQLHGSHGLIGNSLGFTRALVTGLNLLVFIFPDGLLLADKLVGALLIRDMNRNKLLVRSPKICRVMERISVLCLDKNGTITPDVTTVVAGSIGTLTNFVRRSTENEDLAKDHSKAIGVPRSTIIDSTQIVTSVHQDLHALIRNTIVVTSTASEHTDPVTRESGFVGNKLEVALLQFCQESGLCATTPDEPHDIVEYIPFSSDRKASGAVVAIDEHKYRLYVKGAAHVLARRCYQYASADTGKGASHPLLHTNKRAINNTLNAYDANAFRAIALCYKNFDTWPPEDMKLDENNEFSFADLTCDLVLVAILALEDPLRAGIAETISQFQKAGVTIKLCTGDSLGTACSAARRCGILSISGTSVDGDAFRQLEDSSKYPDIQVLAKCSPDDKRVFIEGLQAKGETVALIGDGINDVAALTAAHVGFSMGVCGTDAANNASDVVLMSEDLLPIYRAILWSRHVCKGLRELLQFHLITDVTVIALVGFTSFVNPTTPILPSQLLIWIKLITNIVAPFALLCYWPLNAYPEGTPDAGGLLLPLQTSIHILVQGFSQSLAVLLFRYRVVTLGFTLWYSPSGARDTLVCTTFALMHFTNLAICIWRYFSVLSENAARNCKIGILIILGIGWHQTFAQMVTPQTSILLGIEWTINIVIGAFVLFVGYAVNYHRPND